jgi:hypothetical protein
MGAATPNLVFKELNRFKAMGALNLKDGIEVPFLPVIT